ncbi:asparagine synthase-related protein [Jeotgalibacillus proteolyticus]|uniref:asparagine synthase (glutamine-hydrolyzing) n=1 Tax=Jeotgalibacillus proteolyticus TaxID=2082395 RepID=A0A2S5G898_9BACL|nr:asparagine synthase-related protein [Jeotgalibacillus proteolyticus]PPA69227.1 asparagine synthetase B [Jeotgalibacillus proteolyticus]
MSAIAGLINLNNEPVSAEYGRAMMNALAQFPSDDRQSYRQQNVFMGCHLQWITEESVGEQLPFYDYQKQLVITADALIDNRKELFDQLQIAKQDQKGMPDSRLILLAYEKWGEDSPMYLRGDFSFMIWDEKERKLFGARDFSGTRTLYYYRDSSRFAFCTMIQPFLSLPFVKKRINELWLAEYLAIPGMHETVEPFSTVYENIDQIPPSHSLTLVNGKITIKKYETVKMDAEKLKLRSSDDYIEAFQHVFQKAVAARTRTIHSVGSQLSGGLDSGSVVSFAAPHLKRQNKLLQTFSYVPENDFKDWTPKSRIADERPLIKSTVNFVGNIKDHYLDFKGRSPYSEINEWLEIYEMPYKFFENSFWTKGIYQTAQQQGVGVLLNGGRGNWTVSWGPALEYQTLLFKKLRLIQLFREVNQYSKNIGAKKSRVWSVVKGKIIAELSSPKSAGSFPLLINSSFADKTGVLEKIKEHKMDAASYSYFNSYEARRKQFEKLTFCNITGTNGTKLSLRYKVMGRDPTNDLDVINFCLSVPEDQYVQNGVDRLLIRRATENYLPDDIRLNQKVRGIQGSDGIHRMQQDWKEFMAEVYQVTQDPIMKDLIDMDVLRAALSRTDPTNPGTNYVYNANFKTLMRSIIVSRFIKKII